jgi:hypothetical protein
MPISIFPRFLHLWGALPLKFQAHNDFLTFGTSSWATVRTRKKMQSILTSSGIDQVTFAMSHDRRSFYLIEEWFSCLMSGTKTPSPD